MAYSEFARFYDRVEGDAPAGFSRWILGRLDEYAATVRSVLELGCGTGAVLEALPSEWAKVGVDSSSDMLEQARSKGLGVTLVEADMTGATLGKTFDLVICVFDTINHLLDPEDWRRTFRVAHNHLRSGGLFLFDMNTLGRLRAIASEPAWVHDFEGNTLIMKISDVGSDQFDWDIRVFEVDGDHFRLHRDIVQESALPLAKVRELLSSEGFDVLESRDGNEGEATEDSRRVFFVCRST